MPSRDARPGDDEHRRILDVAARLERGEDIPTISGQQHKMEISAKILAKADQIMRTGGNPDGIPFEQMLALIRERRGRA